MQILGNVGRFRDVRILLRESSHNDAGSRGRVLKIVTLVKFLTDFEPTRTQIASGTSRSLRYDYASPNSGDPGQSENNGELQHE